MVSVAVYTFSNDVASPAHARAAARSWAGEATPESLLALELVISELVTNAVRHSEGEVTMSLEALPAGIEVRVHDHSSRLPVARPVEADRPGGRGLHLVQNLSSSWGTSAAADRGGKTVWAVISTEDDPVSALMGSAEPNSHEKPMRSASQRRSVRL